MLAANLIRYIGDEVLASGKPIFRLHVSAEIINAWSAEIASVLFEDLTEKGFIRVGSMSKTATGILHCINVTLSLEGWEQYEAQKHGAISGN